ncbi:MAG: hypothetical protein IJ561_01520 [Ruminococcus sp.]|nr:hypothetical protein [Ruminococcus sp.]
MAATFEKLKKYLEQIVYDKHANGFDYDGEMPFLLNDFYTKDQVELDIRYFKTALVKTTTPDGDDVEYYEKSNDTSFIISFEDYCKLEVNIGENGAWYMKEKWCSVSNDPQLLTRLCADFAEVTKDMRAYTFYCDGFTLTVVAAEEPKIYADNIPELE